MMNMKYLKKRLIFYKFCEFQTASQPFFHPYSKYNIQSALFSCLQIHRNLAIQSPGRPNEISST